MCNKINLIMKKIYLTLCVIVTLFVSCDKILDNQVPPHDLEATNVITNESSALTALNGIYSEFGLINHWGGPYIAEGAIRCNFLSGVGLRVVDYKNALTELRVTSEFSPLKEAWTSTYKMINAANNFIYYVELLEDNKFGENRKNELLAEAKFIRAFCHMYLMKMFSHFWNVDSEYGPLMRLEPSLLSNSFKARSTVKEAYDLILKDYDFAIKYGAESSSALSVNKYLAQAFKAEALTIRGSAGDYELAGKLADSVINESSYALEGVYSETFTKGLQSSELMFSRIRNSKLASTTNKKLEDFFASNKLSPSETYLEIMADTIFKTRIEGQEAIIDTLVDTRLNFTVDSLMIPDRNGVPRKTLVWKKLYNPDIESPMFYMRLAQMYLIKAEALYRTGASVSAVLDPINIIRKRSGNVEYDPANTSANNLNNIIFKEYILELGLENASEYYASIRFTNNGGSNATSVNRKLRDLNPSYQEDNQLCLPIPTREITYNALIVPNP
jgi:hypothetical protein